LEKVHLIGNAHLDPVWLWQWQEGFAEIKATFRSALDRMKEFDKFKFTSACSAYYMWIEKSDPQMFEEIKERVKEGRWNIVGGWFVQPDCNMPSGESFARHALISQRYFKEKFGITAKTGYNVDSFGHNGNLPQILKKSGMDNYVFMRPGKREKELEASLFDWESKDGSCVRTFRVPIRYNINLACIKNFEDIRQMPENTDMMAFYGVGNHGGGATIELLYEMKRTLSDDFVYSTPDEYFNCVKDEKVPVLNDDLQYHAKGCYSVLSEVKADNQKAENMLFSAEAFSVLSKKLMNTKYPCDEFERAWKNVLFNQFHDILCGCSIKEAYDDARNLHGEAMSIADRNTNFALQQISWNIDTMQGKELSIFKKNYPLCPVWQSNENIGTPVVLFNPLAYEVETVVCVRSMPKYMTDDEGNIIPVQAVRDSLTNGPLKHKTAFVAKVPAFGYSVYRMYFEEEKEALNSSVCASDTHIENEFIKAEFDKETGEILSLTDKRNGEILIKECCEAVLLDETSYDTWAHDIKEFKNIFAKNEKGTVKMIENGPVRAAVRSVQSFENTRIIRDYYLSAKSDEIIVKTKIDFYEKHKMLKFTLPVNKENPKAYAEIPYSHIERPTDGTEQVFGSWISLGGVGIATDSKHSFDADGNALSLTVLRGAVFADHYGQDYRDELCEYIDQGEHFFTYSIFPFKSPSDATKRSQKLNNAPTAIMETFHKGSLETVYSGISVSEENIVVTAIKKNEDSDAVVLRCFEADNRNTKAQIKIFETEFETEFSNNEIKTFVINGKKVTETNLIEWESDKK